jgi:hypothetical protein
LKLLVYTILLCSVVSLAIGQVVSPQKVRFQEVDMDSSRTNHNGPKWGFWWGAHDTTFFFAMKDSFEVFINGKLVEKIDSSYLALGRKKQKTFGLRFFAKDSLGSTILLPDFVGATDVFVILPRPNPAGDTVAYRRNRFRIRISTSGQWLNDSTILVAGSNVTFSQTGNEITIASTGGGGAVGDTLKLTMGNNKWVIQTWIPARTDSMLAQANATKPPPWPGGIVSSGTLQAPTFTDPPGTFAGDSLSIHWRVAGRRTLKYHAPVGLSDLELIIQFKDSVGNWRNAGLWYGSNQLGGPPWYLDHDTLVTWNSVAGGGGNINMLYYGWGMYQYYLPSPRVTWWNMGVHSGGQLEWRLHASRYGYSPPAGDDATFDQISAGDWVGNILIWSNMRTYAGYWQTIFTIDSGNVHINSLLATQDIRAYRTVQGLNGWFDNVVVGHTPATNPAVTDTIPGQFSIVSDSGGVLTVLVRGKGTKAVVILIDTTATGQDTIATNTLVRSLRLMELSNHNFPKYVKAGTNMTFSSSANGDTLTLTPTPGAGPSGASFYTQPAERPPTSPSSFNDELDGVNGTLPDTGNYTHKWQYLGASGHPNTAVKQWSGALLFSDTASVSGDFGKFLGQKITDTAWSFAVRMTASSGGLAYTYAGVFVFDSTTTKGTMYNRVFDGTDQSGLYMNVQRFTDQKTFSAVTTQRQREVARFDYIKVEKTAAKVMNCYTSMDGIAWHLFHTEASTTYMETAGNKINWIGIMVGCTNTGKNITAAFWWFRYNWTADFDPTLHY